MFHKNKQELKNAQNLFSTENFALSTLFFVQESRITKVKK